MASEKEEVTKIKEIRKLETPVIYIRHVYHLRVNELIHQHPVYINVIRDPVDTIHLESLLPSIRVQWREGVN